MRRVIRYRRLEPLHAAGQPQCHRVGVDAAHVLAERNLDYR